MKIVGVIPARWGSTRFPGKPLHKLAGKELVLHVWDRCVECKLLDDLVIATDDIKIYEACENYGAKVVMTKVDHPSGTDRLGEVANLLPDATHFINIQGDEPLIEYTLIDELAQRLIQDSNLEMVTAASEICDEAQIIDSNIVKVVFDNNYNALYFSRSPIPFARKVCKETKYFRHLGIYGYQKDFLESFLDMAPSFKEEAESLEQLRALDSGAKISIVITEDDAIGVDTLEQALVVEQLILKRDSIG